MLTRRYLYYLLLGTQLVNFSTFVPTLLIADRYHGAPSSLIIGIIVGILLQSLALLSLSAFPKQTIQGVLSKGGVSRWVSVPLQIYLIFIEYAQGLLWGFLFVKLFSLNPVLSNSAYVITGLIVILIIYALQQQPLTILFVLEILFVIVLPVLIFFIVKTISDDQLSWDAIGEAATYVRTLPTWGGIAVSVSMFSGYTSLTLFQRNINWRTSEGRPLFSHILLITMGSGVFLLLTGYFVPIGFFGMEASGQLSFIWFLVADSVRMSWFIIGRFSYVFLLLLAIFTVFAGITSWYIAFGSAKALFIKRSKKGEWLLLAVFAAVPFGFVYMVDQNLWVRLSRYFLISRMIGSVCLVALLLYSARKKRKTYV